jgi:hypothetical protein
VLVDAKQHTDNKVCPSLSLSLLYADIIFGGYSKSSWKHMDVQC